MVDYVKLFLYSLSLFSILYTLSGLWTLVSLYPPSTLLSTLYFLSSISSLSILSLSSISSTLYSLYLSLSLSLLPTLYPLLSILYTLLSLHSLLSRAGHVMGLVLFSRGTASFLPAIIIYTHVL